MAKYNIFLVFLLRFAPYAHVKVSKVRGLDIKLEGFIPDWILSKVNMWRSICVLMTAKGYQLLRRGPFHNSPPPPRFVPFVTRESFQISTSKVHIVNCGREYVRAGLV